MNRIKQRPRLAFYSYNGGVGCSTATAVTAWHLTKLGRNVLVLDFDLTSPGLSSSLLPKDQQPTFGLIDLLANEHLIDRAVATAPLAVPSGKLLVVPAYGTASSDYLAKLEHGQQCVTRLVETIEEHIKPDIVLLDLSSGLIHSSIHILTNTAVEILLFARDSDQTWAGYRQLLNHWLQADTIHGVREQLHVVAALVPEIQRTQYLEEFREKAWDLLLDYAYDELNPAFGEQEHAFTFDLMDVDAPHNPIPIYWSAGFASLKNVQVFDESLVRATFGHFLSRIDLMLSWYEEMEE